MPAPPPALGGSRAVVGNLASGLAMRRMNAEKGVHRPVEVARLPRRKLVMITEFRESEQWRYYTERVRPLMGPDDPEPRGERTSRAMPPPPVA
ncbi:hypothetical protein [Nocardia sp. CA-119907]|uniref:hypothetical protein n=1 Tax=Nocardia sp. CA-119907 TaxID=3239973 RepID=UPI003D973056